MYITGFSKKTYGRRRRSPDNLSFEMKIIFVVLTNIVLFACVNNNRTDAPELLDKILDKQILIKNNRVRLIGSPINNDKLWELYKKEIDN